MAIPEIYNLYSNIIIEALSVFKIKLNKCIRDFMIEIFMLYLNIPTRINFLQLGRYSRSGEQRFHRQFDRGLTSFPSTKPCRCLGWANAIRLPLIRVSSINQASIRPEPDTLGQATLEGTSG